MNPLNDDELNRLLQHAKANPPMPSPELAARALRAYEGRVVQPPAWRRILLRPISIPWPVGVLAALLLVWIGQVLRATTVTVQTRTVEVPVTHERVVYRDCTAAPPEASPQIASFTLKDMQPVRQFRPRIVRSIRDDQ